MKQLKTIILVVTAFWFSQSIKAQEKVAHVDVKEIMDKIPDMQDAQKQLEKLRESLTAEYKKMENDYQIKYNKYSSNISSQTIEETIKSRSKELEMMRDKMEEFVKNAETKMIDKDNELEKAILDKISKSIIKVGRAKGFLYVLNKSDTLLSDGPDLTADVKKDLGI